MTVKAPQRLRTIALPAEHGSWGFTIEPILLGLLAAPSWGGVGLALGTFGLFLLRWPLKIWQTSRQQNRQTRTQLAFRFVILYGLLAGSGFALAIGLAGWRPLWPLLLALPFGLIFLWYDRQNRSRSWQAELTGPVAFAAVATSIALAGGWSIGPALALWAVLIARAVPSVLYVRARLRLDRNQPHQSKLTLVAHLAALLLIGWLIWYNWLSPLTIGVSGLLLGRAAIGLSHYRRTVPVKVIGISELGWGLLNVLVVALG